MTADLTPIETTYRGYRFRSRLEARWAVFFTTLGVYYRYEPEGFDLGEHVWYLPDFWLYELNAWFEVKGKVPEAEDQEKVERLAIAAAYPVYVAVGDCAPAAEETGNELVRLSQTASDAGYAWCECERCGLVGIEFAGLAERLPCSCRDPAGPRYPGDATPRLLVAYQAARQARFDRPRRARHRTPARTS